MEQLPVISYQNLLDTQDTEVTEHAAEAFTEIGFFILKDHPLSSSLQNDAYRAFEQFFSLSDKQKLVYSRPNLHYQRGYTGKNKEKAVGSNVPDLKEFYHVGQPTGAELGLPENVWPTEVPMVRDSAIRVFTTLEEIGLQILRQVALHLNLDADYFSGHVRGGNSILRPIHYYPLDQAVPAGAVRAAAHGDINLITLLMGASAEGLQVQSRQGHWIDANPEKDELVINVGDMLDRLTNHTLKSTVHRVINPRHEAKSRARYSMPFFMHPKSNMDLTPLPQCVTSTNPKRYENQTAGQFLQARLKEIGLA